MKKIITKILILLAAIGPASAVVAKSSADRFKSIAGGAGFANLGGGPQSIVINIITYILGLIGVFFLVLIIYAGWQWIAAGGNEETIEKAKDRLKNAIIGLGVIIASYAITSWVLSAINSAGGLN